MKKFLSKSAATFKSGEIKKDSTTGELKYEITHLKFTPEEEKLELRDLLSQLCHLVSLLKEIGIWVLRVAA